MFIIIDEVKLGFATRYEQGTKRTVRNSTLPGEQVDEGNCQTYAYVISRYRAAIKKVKLQADGERGTSEDDDIKSKSKATQAVKLFSELKTPVEVAIALDLSADQVQAIYQEYWELEGMYGLTQIYEEAKHDLQFSNQ